MLLLKINGMGLLFYFMLYQSIGFSNNKKNLEPWININDIYNIQIDMTTEDVKKNLGDPLFIESIYDGDVIITQFVYSFKTKTYDKKIMDENTTNISDYSHKWGRTTNIQFTFENEKLISWEEDKLTLSMAASEQSNKGSVLQFLSLLLNLILIVKVF